MNNWMKYKWMKKRKEALNRLLESGNWRMNVDFYDLKIDVQNDLIEEEINNG